MDLTNMSKNELLEKCKEFGITKYKSKNKNILIDLIKTQNSQKKNIIFIIKNDNEDTQINTTQIIESQNNSNMVIEPMPQLLNVIDSHLNTKTQILLQQNISTQITDTKKKITNQKKLTPTILALPILLQKQLVTY